VITRELPSDSIIHVIQTGNILTKPGTVGNVKITKVDTTLKYEPEIKVKKIKRQ
jgi:hypothetical protein